jgi:hypothetical protein
MEFGVLLTTTYPVKVGGIGCRFGWLKGGSKFETPIRICWIAGGEGTLLNQRRQVRPWRVNSLSGGHACVPKRPGIWIEM